MISAAFKPAPSASSTTYYVHPDHLGSTGAVTNQAGAIQQSLSYYPYGSERINSGVDASDRRFISQFKDDSTSLNYLNTRFYSSDRGQFLSLDPVFLGIGTDRRTTQALQNPQLLNSYSYAMNNPIVYKDPNGEWIHIAAGGLIGGGIGLLAQGFEDGLSGDLSSYEAYAGAAAGGAAFGAVTAATGGLSLVATPFIGAGSGLVQSGVEQSLMIAAGKQDGVEGASLIGEAASGAVGSFVPGLRIAGVSVGKGSYSAVQKQVLTKLQNGTISIGGVQPFTYGKIFTSNIAQQGPSAGFQATLGAISRQLTQISATISALIGSQKKDEKKK